MTASICDSVSDALHLSLLNDSKKKNLLDNCLIASARSVQLNKIEFEETGCQHVSNCNFLNSRNVIILSSNSANDSTCDPDKQLKYESGPSNIAGCSSSSKDSGLPRPKRTLYPLASVKLGWDSGWQVGSGMHNLGNTCYLNSTLQALFHVPAFSNWLLCELHNDFKCDCVTCGMRKTLQETQNSNGPIKPWRIQSKLRDICSYFTPMNQEDAHEFLRYLINAMVKSYLRKAGVNEKETDSYSKETTPLHQILGGYLRSAVRCLTCSHVSITYQHFQDLLVDARNANTLDEALKSFFSKETLDDCGYKCEACNKKVSATKQFFIERPPMVLCIAIKRFSPTGGKLSKRIQYKTKICIKNYLTSRQNNPPSLTYRLVSVVNHIGNSQDSGHYTALGLAPGGSYYHFDDSSVWPVSPNNIVSANAYILFYELEKSDSIILQGLMTPYKSPYKRRPEESAVQKIYTNGSNDKFKKHKIQIEGLPNGNSSFTLSPPSSKESSPNSSLSSESIESNLLDNHIPIKIAISKPKSKLVENSFENQISNKNHNSYGESRKYDFQNGSPSSENKQNGSFKSFPSNRVDSNTKPAVDVEEKENNREESSSHKFDNKSLDDYNSHKKDFSETSPSKSHSKMVKGVKNDNKLSWDSDKEDYKRRDKLFTQKWIVVKKDITKATVAGWEVSTDIPVSLPSPSRNGIVNSRLIESDDNSLHNKASSSTIHYAGNKNNNTKHHPNKSNSEESNGTASSHSNNNGSCDKKAVVSHLMRQSHIGYGAPVSSWNGTHSQLDRQVYEDKKKEKKRAADADDEMDHGRQKKIRRHNNYHISSSNNQYQEVQNRRILWNSNRPDNYNRPNQHYGRSNFNPKYNRYRYNNHFNHRGHYVHRNHHRRNC